MKEFPVGAIVLFFFIRSWMVMIGFGGLHSFYPQVPNISYGVSLIVVFTITFLFMRTIVRIGDK